MAAASLSTSASIYLERACQAPEIQERRQLPSSDRGGFDRTICFHNPGFSLLADQPLI